MAKKTHKNYVSYRERLQQIRFIQLNAHVQQDQKVPIKANYKQT